MARHLSPDAYAKTRALVEDGKLRVGSPPHLAVIQHDIDVKNLTSRDRRIIVLAIRGWTQVSIAEAMSMSRTTVGYVIRDFFNGR
jgi:DNA-binding NarL/FixJ family response regulator